jgi:hypothetical protein
MSAFTPSPWVFSEDSNPSNDGEWPIRGKDTGDDFVVVARVTLQEDCARGKGWTFGRNDDLERAANGHLIAAAPELYAAAAASIEAIQQGEPKMALIYLGHALKLAEGGA